MKWRLTCALTSSYIWPLSSVVSWPLGPGVLPFTGPASVSSLAAED